jgi:hypothetical protein
LYQPIEINIFNGLAPKPECQKCAKSSLEAVCVRQAKLQPVEREGGSARPVASVAGSSVTAKRTQRDDEDCIELRKTLTVEAEALRTAAGNMCGTVMRGLHRGPVRAVKDRVGTWETSDRPQPPWRSRVGSGRRGAEAGPEGRRRPHSTDEASNNTGRRVGGGERGGKGRRKGKGQRMPRTQSRTRHVPDGPSPRTGTGAQAPNTGRV